MAGQMEEIIGNESLEELEEKLDKELFKGSKMGIERRLDFNVDLSTDYGKQAHEAFKRGEYLKFLVEQSDALAESLQDADAGTYSRTAGRVAEIVKKYMDIAPRWDKLAQDESKKYKDSLKRFLGTHQGIAESFLAKLIEQTKGKEERDRFVVALNNQGFDFVEGFDVEIDTMSGKEQQVRVSYKKEKDGKVLFEYNEIVPKEIIDNLILGKLEKE